MEFHGCDTAVLDDVEFIEALLRQAAEAAGTTCIAAMMRPFEPHGVTGVLVLAESHLSIHTWPEAGYASVDLYSCGDSTPEKAYSILRQGLLSRRSEVLMVTRGQTPPGPSMKIVGHHSTAAAQAAIELETTNSDR